MLALTWTSYTLGVIVSILLTRLLVRYEAKKRIKTKPDQIYDWGDVWTWIAFGIASWFGLLLVLIYCLIQYGDKLPKKPKWIRPFGPPKWL